MKLAALFIAASVLVSGCAGISTLRVATVPDEAKLYVNNQYAGTTPKTVPAPWRQFLWWYWGDAVSLRMEKEGYKIFEKTIRTVDWWERYKNSDYQEGSEFGWGETYPYTFHLEKK